MAAVPAEHDQRPWGDYRVLDDAPEYNVKRITVLPGKRLSYQRHARRREHWLIVHGAGRVTVEGREFDVRPGAAFDVPVGAAHRMANPDEAEPLVFIEVQRGDYFGEDDIVRSEDDYGRTDQRPHDVGPASPRALTAPADARPTAAPCQHVTATRRRFSRGKANMSSNFCYAGPTPITVRRISDKPIVEAGAVAGYGPIFNAGVIHHDGRFHLFARGGAQRVSAQRRHRRHLP